jgi:hypothetical protein
MEIISTHVKGMAQFVNVARKGVTRLAIVGTLKGKASHVRSVENTID